MGICCSRCPKIYCSCCQGDEDEERQSAALGSYLQSAALGSDVLGYEPPNRVSISRPLPTTCSRPLPPQPGSTELHEARQASLWHVFSHFDSPVGSEDPFTLDLSPPRRLHSGSIQRHLQSGRIQRHPQSGSTQRHPSTVFHPHSLLRDPEIKVTHQSNTCITLRSSEEDCKLNDCFKKAQELLRPGVRELILTGTNFLHLDPIEPKNETLELLRIRAERGNLHHLLPSVAQHCSALTELELTLGETYRTDPPPLASVVCHSLRVLDLSVRQLTLVDLIALLDVISVVYPNVQRLSINVTGPFQTEEKSLIKDAGLQLHHLDVLQFSSQGMDPEGEHHLQLTVYAFCPQLAKTKSQDGASFFRRIHGASGYVDQLGGELSIPAHDVKLSIPPGALEDREKISIEVFSELPNGINLQDNEVVTNYGFRCFPSGLTFKKPLILSMPHCAIIDDHESIRMMLYFGNNEEEEMTRIPLELGEYVIHSERFELKLHHFSWGIATMIYNWLFPGGKSESQETKRMLCTPFIPSTLPNDQDCPILRLRIYSQLPGLSEEIREEEKSLNYNKVCPDEELIVKEDSIDMSIICESDDSREKKEVTTRELLQHSKLTVCIRLPKRKSTITLIVRQEREITMEFWPNFKVEEVEDVITPQRTMQLGQACTRSPQTDRRPDRLYPPALGNMGGIPESSGSVVSYAPSRGSDQNLRVQFRQRSNFDCLTDEQLEDLSRRLPLDKFTAICARLGFSNTETENVRTKSSDAQIAYFTMLTRWQGETGAPKAQLVDVLKNVKLFGLAQSCLETDNDPEDIDSS